jgi:hypothetical protein
MNADYNNIVDRLLDMQPDPIPKFVLLKEFKGCSPDSIEYQNAYERVCEHPFIKDIVESQNNKGFWPSYHGDTEGSIRKLLWYGLDNSHICLKRVTEYTVKLLCNEESHDRIEKQDNIRWWPEMFMPLCVSATLSLLDNSNENLVSHRKRWADFTELAFVSGGENHGEADDAAKSIHSDFFTPLKGPFNHEAYAKAQCEYFGFNTKRIIHPFNLYCLLLLAPLNGETYLSAAADQALVDYGMKVADHLYYVYNKNLGELVLLEEQNKDSRDFCHWIRALSLISQFKGWAKYEQKYVDWIMGQRNQDGLWEYTKKHYLFGLSDSWKGKNRAIDSTIFVLRMLMKKKAL